MRMCMKQDPVAIELALARARPPHLREPLAALALHEPAVRGAERALLRLGREKKLVRLLEDAIEPEVPPLHVYYCYFKRTRRRIRMISTHPSSSEPSPSFLLRLIELSCE